jgi:hypothetical protein
MKGHNQSKNKQTNPLPEKPKGKGQSEHLKNQAQEKQEGHQGRNDNEDQSGGTKGANSI